MRRLFRQLQETWAARAAHVSRGPSESLDLTHPRAGAQLEAQFLPAILEVELTPPSPLGRLVMWTLIALCAVALVWSLFPIEITAVAQGKVVPSGQVKIIQPYETGIIRAIRVSEGQGVKAGDILVELDPSVAQADLARLESEATQTRADVERLRQQAARHGTVEAADIDPELMVKQNTLLASLDAEHRAKLGALDNEIAKGHATVAAAASAEKKLEQTLPLISERAEKYGKAMASGHFPRFEYLALEEQRITQEQDLAVQRSRRAETTAAVALAKSQKATLIAEYQRSALEQLNQQEARLAELGQEIIKARQRIGWQTLTSPVDGTAQQIKIHTVGGVVTPAQELLTVVPASVQTEVEAYLPNKDIGFVKPGLTARIKVETFPFTRYGTVSAQVFDVSDDAVAIESLGLVYTLRAKLDSDRILVDGKSVKLTPGMAITAEVNTGKRRILEYFLSPVLRYADESIKER